MITNLLLLQFILGSTNVLCTIHKRQVFFKKLRFTPRKYGQALEGAGNRSTTKGITISQM